MDRGTGGLFTPLGVLMHHTAGGANGNLPSLGIVRDGHAGLSGPLSQLMLSRSGVFHVIAAGRANHAGAGTARFVPNADGNRYLIGIEAESTGVRDDWTLEQRINYPRGVAALCRWMHVSELNVLGHKEWAPTRKVDPAFWDMRVFRADVRNWLRGSPPPPPPAPPKPPHKEEDAMYIKCRMVNGATVTDLTGILSGPLFIGLGSKAEKDSADLAIKAGATVQWVETFTWNALAARNPRPDDVTKLGTQLAEISEKLDCLLPDDDDDQAA